jgi:hypothetical protein
VLRAGENEGDAGGDDLVCQGVYHVRAKADVQNACVRLLAAQKIDAFYQRHCRSDRYTVVVVDIVDDAGG